MKAKTYASLKREADKVFSEWIRRGAVFDNIGTAVCVTCAAPHHWKRLQCGHFVSRVHLATRWDEQNCAPQCYACNILRRGSPAEFAQWLMESRGLAIIDELVERKRTSVKYTRADLTALIDTYKQKLSELPT